MTDATESERELRRLLGEQAADAAALTASLDQVRAARADGTADDEHDPEGSTLTSDWSRMTGFAVESEVRTREILAALERIADGRYGTCTRCGEPIAEARLAARPWAAQCVDCAAVLEQRRR